MLFHSDQGTQYTSYAFRTLLKKHNITQSFSNPGRPYNNSVAESFFSSLKQEELYRNNYTGESHLIKSVGEYIEFYNEKRPHKTNNYKTPSKIETEFYDKN